MQRAIVFIAALLCCLSTEGRPARGAAIPGFTQPGINIIGPGSTTFAYIDRLNKPCGVGMKSSGIYPVAPLTSWGGNVTLNGTTTLVVNSTSSGVLGPGSVLTGTDIPTSPETIIVSGTPTTTGTATFIMSAAATGSATENITGAASLAHVAPAWYTMGDTPDADPDDASVCTTAQWSAKWGCASSACNQLGDNAAMVSWLTARGYTNNGHIYYIAQTGNDSTAVVNDPSHPYATLVPVMTALDTTAENFCGLGTVASGSNVLTVTSVTTSGPCLGSTLARSSHVTATGIPANDFIITQISGTQGGVGTYMMTINATASHSAEAITGSVQPGGVIAVRAGDYPYCTTGTGSVSCLNFNPCTVATCWQLSGAPGQDLLVMAFPGEVVQIQGGISLAGTYQPGQASCCLIIRGLEFWDPTYDDGDAIDFDYYSQLTIEYNEFAGWDKIAGATTYNISILHNVFHDMFAHSIYFEHEAGTSPGCESLYTPGVDTNFAQDRLNYIAGTSCGATYGGRVIGNVVYSSGNGGYDQFHLNTWQTGAVVSGNICSYCSQPLSLQTGEYNSLVIGNLFLDISKECYLEYQYPENPPSDYTGATHRWNTFSNNVCSVPSYADIIQGTNPSGAILMDDGTTGGISYIKDSTIQNNILVTYDTSASTDSIPFQFELHSYPETNTVNGNTLWSTGTFSCTPGSGTCRAAIITSGAGQSGIGANPGTYLFNSGSFNFSTSYPSNTYASTNPLPGVTESCVYAPGTCDLTPYQLH